MTEDELDELTSSNAKNAATAHEAEIEELNEKHLVCDSCYYRESLITLCLNKESGLSGLYYSFVSESREKSFLEEIPDDAELIPPSSKIVAIGDVLILLNMVILYQIFL